MKKLSDILRDINPVKVFGPADIPVDGIVFDSRAKGKDLLFAAISGTKMDGHDFLAMAVENGATSLLVERMPEHPHKEVTYIVVEDTSAVLGLLARNFYDDPSSRLTLVGVTGTNGKTTTATLLYEIFTVMGHKCGLLSTVKVMVAEQEIPATHTTPDVVTINKYLCQMLEEGCDYCFMEVSSHGIVQGRINGLTFRGGIFTNLTHDHLDFHKTFQGYRDAKKGFFDRLPKGSFALTNLDDKNGMFMLQNTAADKKTYSLRSASDFKAKILENRFEGLLLDIDGHEVLVRLVGEFNAYNLLAVYATGVLLGIEPMDMLVALSRMQGVRGRFESFISGSGVVCIVDYAHTPDAVDNVIRTIRSIRKGGETFTTVIGCGGDRDKTKRPEMAQIACQGSDRVILTSDNPRSEEPDDILRDMQGGVPVEDSGKVLVITDRYQAIKTACMIAKKGDIILVAGKGHETYQEVKGVRHHFDDMETLHGLLK